MTATVDRPMSTPPAGSTERLDPWRGFDGRGVARGRRRRRLHPRQLPPYAGDADLPRRPDRAHDRALGGAAAALRRRARARHPRRRPGSRRAPSPPTRPGYIDRDHELIVGLQTDAPLKRAIMPNGGWRMVENGLEAYGYELDPAVREIFTKYRKTHNDGVFDAYTPTIRAARRGAHHHRPARRLRPRPDHRRLPAGRALRRGPR